MAFQTLKTKNSGSRIDPLIFKDLSLGTDTTNFFNQSLKDRSLQKEESLENIPSRIDLSKEKIYPSISIMVFFEIFGIWESQFLCQRLIFQRQTTFYLTKMGFSRILKGPKIIFGP